MDRRSLGVAALGVLVVLSGCADVAVETTVAGDGTIETYAVSAEMSPSAYDTLQSTAESEGYDSIERYLLRGVNESRAETVAYDQNLTDDGNVTIDLTLESWDPGPSSSVSTTVENETITVEDRTFLQDRDAIGSGYALTYTLTMPTNVTESTTGEVDGRTATWEYAPDEAIDEPIRAESDTPSDGAGPGFGVATALVATVLTVAMLARRR